jgi:hypothetical protein
MIRQTPLERVTDHAIRKMRKRNEDGAVPHIGA